MTKRKFFDRPLKQNAILRHIRGMNTFLYQFRLAQELKRLARENAKSGKQFSLMDDAVFKTMFAADSEDSREALRYLLSACTRREVTGVQIMNNELNPVYLGGKAPRLDIHVRFNDGEAADLEMQMSKTGDDLGKRAIVYTSLLVVGQSKRGDTYDEHDRLSDLTETLVYELPKLERQVQDFLAGKLKIKNLSKDARWCIYFKYRFDQRAETLIKRLSREDEGIMRAEKTLAKVDKGYLKWVRTMADIKNRMDHASKMQAFEDELRAAAIAEGRAQGKIEGLAERNIEIAAKLKASGMPTEEICSITGLSPEAINRPATPKS